MRYLLGVVIGIMGFVGAPAQAATVWVSPTGNDHNAGTASKPLRTVRQAWQQVPGHSAQPYRIKLRSGTYRNLPEYWEQKTTPTTVQGIGKVTLRGTINMFQVSHFSLSNITIKNTGDVFHCEQCDHVNISNSRLLGSQHGGTHETVKVNQSAYVQITDSTLSGADDNAFDAVAVNHLLLARNLIMHATDWCAYAKGGSSDVRVLNNRFRYCGVGAFTAGQGSGLQWMQLPHVTYEAEHVLVQGNTAMDIDGAAWGVHGGNDVRITANVAYRIGQRSHLLEVGYGQRSCDGSPDDTERNLACRSRLQAGGWGTLVEDDGSNWVAIPNHQVSIDHNIFDNPAPYRSQWQHLQIDGPPHQPQTGGVPQPVAADDGLSITHNWIWNGPRSMELGIGDDSGCHTSLCNSTQLQQENRINTMDPQLRPAASNKVMLPATAVSYLQQ